ncbi:MAG: HAD family hydrolase [Clostridia bacterium]|nr:HAD family hydrolase [Clostridia bacterium]
MMNIKAIVLDLDRTLLKSDKTISDFTLSVLERCHEQGIKVIIASARPIRAIWEYDKLLNPDAIIWHNGAAVYIEGENKYKERISIDDTKNILSNIAKIYPESTLSVEIDDVLYANFDVSVHWENTSAKQTDFTDLPDVASYKIIVGVSSMEQIEKIKDILPDGVYIEMSDKKLGLMMHKDATKLKGIKKALDYYSIELSDTVSFGDDYGDIDMLRACGIGVAVENALPIVKEAADYITETNDDDGVAKWINVHVLANIH